jgi:hypothetical protein
MREIYTAPTVDAAQFRKAVRHRGHFPNEQAALNPA